MSRRWWLVEAGCLLVVDILVTLVTLILGVGIPAPFVVPVALFYVRALLVEPGAGHVVTHDHVLVSDRFTAIRFNSSSLGQRFLGNDMLKIG